MGEFWAVQLHMLDDEQVILARYVPGGEHIVEAMAWLIRYAVDHNLPFGGVSVRKVVVNQEIEDSSYYRDLLKRAGARAAELATN